MSYIMSYITEVKTSLKKISSIIEGINGLNKDSMPKLIEHTKKILELIEKFEEEKNSNLKTIESNTDNINSLKNKISQNNRNSLNLEEEIDELTKERQKLLDIIQATRNDLTETLEKINTTKKEFENRSERLKDLESKNRELIKLKEVFEAKLVEIQLQLGNDFEKKSKIVESFGNRVEAMKLLIKKDYIHSSQMQVIKTLQKGTTLEIIKISAAVDMKEEQIKKILRKMVELNGPIKYDETAGTVILKEEVGF